MGVNGVPNTIDIAISGLRAEKARMDVIARNIANSRTTRTPSGQPYRRQEVVLSTDDKGLGGVRFDKVVSDMKNSFKAVYQPGHPDADENGYVLMPNVDLPIEMINLVASSRAYQANAAVMKRYQEITAVALELLK